ncbi:MAG TPA: c-type cytochrome biogenesis protein CcmI [Usitatibacter sp.]|nr:c-type cytochrome biogenesis protein CcmI [Usitatibacter sp.]
MLVFWLLATLMTLVALAFVLVPLLRSRARSAPSIDEANLEVLRAERAAIEADIANGLLPAEAREEALADLIERAQADLGAAGAPAPTQSPRKPWATAAIVAVALPVAAFGLYLALGVPAASDPKRFARAETGLDDEKIVAMVEALARKVKERPDDRQGWMLLARSMAALGRFEESAQAFARLEKLMPGDPQVLTDYADALGMAQGRTLAGRPYELVKQALAIDPRHKKALALAGTAALDAGDFAAALGHWQALAGELSAGSEDEIKVRAIIAETRTRAASAGAPLAAAPASAPPPDPVAKSVSGSVAIAPQIARLVSAADTLFIFARSEGGPRVPLAVLRTSARDLPRAFALDDTQAMAPGARLSGAKAVRIEARISRSGNAMPQPGDLVGTSEVVKPGARDVKIVVDRVLP